MNWYYVTNGQQTGPVTEADFANLIRAGTIRDDTLVWHDGMPEWRPYREVAVTKAAAAGFVQTPGAAFDLRPMSIGDILDRTFRLYRAHFLTFFLLMLGVQAATYLVMLGWQVNFFSVMRAMSGQGNHPTPAFIGAFALLIPIVILIFVLNQVALGTLTAAVSAAFLQQEVSLGNAYRSVRSKLSRLLGATMLSSLFMVLGLLACIVPGIYLLLSYLLVGQVVVLEGLGGRAALKRSKELMRKKTDKGFFKNNVMKASILLLIAFVLGSVVGGIVSVPFAILNVLNPPVAALDLVSPLHLLQGVLTMAVQAAVAPVGQIAMILFYYDIRIRKEGFDLEVLTAALSAREATPAA